MDLGIKGKWALVCGASKGLGLGCAQALAAEGVHVVMVARGARDLEAAGQALQAAVPGVTVLTVAADITTPEGRAAALSVATTRLQAAAPSYAPSQPTPQATLSSTMSSVQQSASTCQSLVLRASIQQALDPLHIIHRQLFAAVFVLQLFQRFGQVGLHLPQHFDPVA